MRSLVMAGVVFTGAMAGGLLALSFTQSEAQEATSSEQLPLSVGEEVYATGLAPADPVEATVLSKTTVAPLARFANGERVRAVKEAEKEAATRDAALLKEVQFARKRGEKATTTENGVARWVQGKSSRTMIVPTSKKELRMGEGVEDGESIVLVEDADEPVTSTYLGGWPDLGMMPIGEAGTFQVVATEFGPIKIDTRSGATWRLTQGSEGLKWVAIDGGNPSMQPRAVPTLPGRLFERRAPMPQKAYLGVTVESSESGEGLSVTSVHSGTAADAVGLRVGDLILSADGQSLSEQQDLGEIIQSKKSPGDSITLHIRRTSVDPEGVYSQSAEFDLTITLGRSER